MFESETNTIDSKPYIQADKRVRPFPSGLSSLSIKTPEDPNAYLPLNRIFDIVETSLSKFWVIYISNF